MCLCVDVASEKMLGTFLTTSYEETQEFSFPMNTENYVAERCLLRAAREKRT